MYKANNNSSNTQTSDICNNVQLVSFAIPISKLPLPQVQKQNNSIVKSEDTTMYCSTQRTDSATLCPYSFFSHQSNIQPYDLASIMNIEHFIPRTTDFSLPEMQSILRKKMNTISNAKEPRRQKLEMLWDKCYDAFNQEPKNLKEYFDCFLSIIQHEIYLTNKWPDSKGKTKLCEFFKINVRTQLFSHLMLPLIFLFKQLEIGEMTWLIAQSASTWCARPELISALEETFFNKLINSSIEECEIIGAQLKNLSTRNNDIIIFSAKLKTYLYSRGLNSLSLDPRAVSRNR